VNERARVLLIDDHEMARRGLRAMLSAADWIEVVGEGDSCESGVKLTDELEPDMVLLDIRMPGLDGLACLERIKSRHPRMAVVIVTLYDDRRYVLEAIRRGAAGYLLKDASTAAVIQTLHNVANGQLAVEPQLLREALASREDPPSAAGAIRPHPSRARRSSPRGRRAY
jgi:DNA-binding NarL/FixJ family response regulator